MPVLSGTTQIGEAALLAVGGVFPAALYFRFTGSYANTYQKKGIVAVYLSPGGGEVYEVASKTIWLTGTVFFGADFPNYPAPWNWTIYLFAAKAGEGWLIGY